MKSVESFIIKVHKAEDIEAYKADSYSKGDLFLASCDINLDGKKHTDSILYHDFSLTGAVVSKLVDDVKDLLKTGGK